MGGNALVLELRQKAEFCKGEPEKRFSKRILSIIASSSAILIGSMVLASCSGGTKSGRASLSLESSQPSYSQSSHRSSIIERKFKRTRQAGRIPLGGGIRKIGKPYKILGRWYTPKHQPNYNRVGIASWYGTKFHGKKTANGEIFDMNNLTAAHPTLPIPSYVRVTNLKNNRSLLLRVNDRGPYAHNRVMDLSRKAADLLGTKVQGTARVRVQYLGPAPLSGDLSREHAYLARQPWFRSRNANRKSNRSWGSRLALGAKSLSHK